MDYSLFLIVSIVVIGLLVYGLIKLFQKLLNK